MLVNLLLHYFSTVACVTGSIAVTIGPLSDLVISNKHIAPDGHLRLATLAGGTFPGPVIVGNKGDRFQINVINDLMDSRVHRATTIHWHGIFQNGTNSADGGAMVSQCPIVNNASFLYDFSTSDQAGTFWYHSHYSTQYCDGLRGAFVVYDPEDPYDGLYDVDDESTIITLADWYPTLSTQHIQSQFTTLINGHGRRVGDANSTETQLSVITVTQGKRYRFRLIAISCDGPFNFTIHHHSFTMIEADGENILPVVADSLWVHAGQRYSIIVTANQTINNYWIRADPLNTRGPSGFDGGRNSAILRYLGAPVKEPISVGTSTRPLNEDNLHALEKQSLPGMPELGGADIVVPIRTRFRDDLLRYEINEATYRSPTIPVLLQILNGTFDADELMPKGSVYQLRANSSVELQFYGLSRGGPHPFHLHGHPFYVVKNPHSNEYDWDNPVLRDTVNTGLDGNLTVVRFFTDNSGPWFLHCHIDWHLDLGLAIIFAEDPEGTEDHSDIPPSWDELCPIFEAHNPDKQYE